MKKRKGIFAAAILLIVLPAGAVYGYWTQQLSVSWQMPVTYPITVEVEFDKTAETAAMPSGLEAKDEQNRPDTNALDAAEAADKTAGKDDLPGDERLLEGDALSD